MAIVKMSHLTVLGMREDYANVLDTLTEFGVLEVHPIIEHQINNDASETEETEETSIDPDAASPDLVKFEDVFVVDETRNSSREAAIAKTAALLGRLEHAIEYLGHKWPLQTKLLDDQCVLTPEQFLAIEAKTTGTIEKLQILEKGLADHVQLTTQRMQIVQEMTMLQPWLGLQVELDATHTARTQILLGQVTDVKSYQALDVKLAELDIPVSLIMLKQHSKNQILLAVVFLSEHSAQVKQVLAGNVFHAFSLVGKKGTPDQHMAVLQEKLATLDASITDNEALQEELSATQLDFCVLYDYLAARLNMAEADRHVAETKCTFTLGGYVPMADVEELKQVLQAKYDVAIASRYAPPSENPPVKLKNKWFNQAYEILLEMFGAPSPGETDPMSVMAPFTWLFFGMMLSDVGYGALLALGCLYMIRVKKVKGTVRRTCTMLMLSGISAMIWGQIFGSFFGDLVTTVSDKAVSYPTLWFNPMEKPMDLMVFSMLLGVVHLYFALFFAILNSAKKGDLIGGILDNVPWYFVISGIGLLLGVGSISDGLGASAATISAVGQWMALGGAAVILLFSGRGTKNPILRLLKGLGSLYSITSWIGDVLSYTRILALVLATSVIATVVNMLGIMVGRTFIGWIVFILVAVFGHILNLSLSSLSAYVHSIRLQYVEFFGRFFGGGGEYYAPLAFEPKYVTIEKTSALVKIKTKR